MDAAAKKQLAEELLAEVAEPESAQEVLVRAVYCSPADRQT